MRGFPFSSVRRNEARLWACANKVSNDLAAQVRSKISTGISRAFRNVLDRAHNDGPRQEKIYRMFRDEATVVEVWGSDRYR
jgi:hypothetical protein